MEAEHDSDRESDSTESRDQPGTRVKQSECLSQFNGNNLIKFLNLLAIQILPQEVSIETELTVGVCFEFEERSSISTEYNREMWTKTVVVIKRINEIKERLEKHFVMERLREGTQREILNDVRDVQKNISIIRAPEGIRKKEDHSNPSFRLSPRSLTNVSTARSRVFPLDTSIQSPSCPTTTALHLKSSENRISRC